MERPTECNNCINIDVCKQGLILCTAMVKLYEMYDEARLSDREEITKNLRRYLNIQDVEPSKKLEKLANRLIKENIQLNHIKDYGIKVGYLSSYEEKTDKGKIVQGECIKIKKTYQAYLPYDFLIVFYENNIIMMNEKQREILMIHELMHIGINENTLRTSYTIIPHDVDDFNMILDEFGNHWNEPIMGDE